MTPTVFFLVLGAALLHACWNFAIKRTAGNLGVLCFGLWLGTLVAAPMALYSLPNAEAWSNGRVYLLGTGLVHGVYFLLLAATYRLGEISIVYPIARGTGVVLTAAIAWKFLGEYISAFGFAGIACITLGVAMLAQKDPRGTAASGKSLLYATGVGCTIAGFSIIDKLGVAHLHPAVLITAIFGMSALIVTPYVMRYAAGEIKASLRNCKREIVVFGVGSSVNYGLILYAYREAPAAYVAALRESSVVVGSLLGIWWLNESFHWRKAVGIGCVIAGLVWLRLV